MDIREDKAIDRLIDRSWAILKGEIEGERLLRGFDGSSTVSLCYHRRSSTSSTKESERKKEKERSKKYNISRREAVA